MMAEEVKTILELDNSGNVVNQVLATEAFAREHFAHWRVGSTDAQQFEIVVTDVRSLKPLHAVKILENGMSEVTAQVGSTIAITAQLRADGELVALDDDFRMPVVSRDGRERVVLAAMQQGIISITIKLESSGVWQVTQEQINCDLPPEQRMRFGGFRIFAYE